MLRDKVSNKSLSEAYSAGSPGRSPASREAGLLLGNLDKVTGIWIRVEPSSLLSLPTSFALLKSNP